MKNIVTVKEECDLYKFLASAHMGGGGGGGGREGGREGYNPIFFVEGDL